MRMLLTEPFARPLVITAAAWAATKLPRLKSPAAQHLVWTLAMVAIVTSISAGGVMPRIPLRVLPPVVIAPSVSALPLALPAPVYRTAPTSFEWSWSYVWAAGAVLLLVRLALGIYTARATSRRATALGMSEGSIPVFESSEVAVPSVSGWKKPRILLPTIWRDWDPATLDAVLAHEAAHVERGDWVLRIVARCARAALWFHPVVWIVERRMSRLAEYAADDLAAAASGDRTVYARALLQVAEGAGRMRVPSMAVAMAKERNVETRIDRILNGTGGVGMSLGTWIAIACVAAPLLTAAVATDLAHRASPVLASSVAGFAPIDGNTPAQIERQPVMLAQARPQPAQAQTSSGGALASAYTNWLNQEVVYIIAPAEREAFLRLGTDEERNMFIQQFWARRGNREEHYRRIAYANEHFGYGSTPGWESDRGRIYIQYGPPDATHITDRAQTEIWQYRDDSNGRAPLYRFQDSGGLGGFRLSSLADTLENRLGDLDRLRGFMDGMRALAGRTPSDYDAWLTQDVGYIVTDNERFAFLRLQTDEERRQFIEQFWLRRDPTPGTPENEFRTEHYRRLAYANVHFGAAGKAGAVTDRGRVYILYGPPDSESRQAGKVRWTYRYIQDLGADIPIEFADAGNGDYRMVTNRNATF